MGNNCNGGLFDNNIIWIILALLFFCNDGIGGFGNFGRDNCGRDNCGCDRGDNSFIWIILLIIFFCCNNNHDRCC